MLISTAQSTAMLRYTGAKIAVAAFIAITCICHIKCADEWQHKMTMDPKGNFQIFWNLSNENITIEVQVRTKGYVALGFSPHGGMKGADIVTAWVKGSQVFIQDRYATGNIEPLIDDIQDYELISGFENDTHTVLQFTRQLESCDQQDFPIPNAITRVIYAWGTDDPVSTTTIEYHGGQNRGTKAFNLFSPKDAQFTQFTDDVIPFDFQMSKLEIPPQQTTYWCQYFKVPETGVKKHVVGLDIILQPGNTNMVHHIVISQCLDQFSVKYESQFNSTGFYCLTPDFMCTLAFMDWTIGIPPVTLPPHIGIPFGKIDKPTYFAVVMHYNNPSLLSGIVDQTTIRFMITEKLRKYDAGMLSAYTLMGVGFIIPPKQENFTMANIIPSECTKKMLPADGINVIITALHGHLTLSKTRLRHFRNGVELPLISHENNYDFQFQQPSILFKEVKVLPGDFLTAHCEYNTMNRTNFTLGGLQTTDEMCNAHLLHYPLANLASIYKDGHMENLMQILETAERKQVHNNVSSAYTMTRDEYVKTFDASILTEQDIAALSYLQTYGRMQVMCIGRDGTVESVSMESANDTKIPLQENLICKKSIKQN